MKHAFFLFIFFLSIRTYSKSQILQKKEVKDYQVIVKWDEALDCERVIITKKGKTVLIEGEAGDHFWIGNYFHDSYKKNDPNFTKDITGNGISDLIISRWNGGAHCCYFLNVFEMKINKLEKLITINGGSYGFDIQDLDGDKIPEISFLDWPIDYLFNSFAFSAQGKVVLKFVDGRYRVAKNLMYRRRPDNKKLEVSKAKIRKSFEDKGDLVPYELLKLMMDLSYTGYKELALKIAEETWPKDRNDLRKFQREFKEALSESIYWNDFNDGEF